MNRPGEELVWLIDPLDGTSNFASGNPPFGIMVALIADGEAIGAWIHDPLAGRMCRAARGQGAFIDDRRVRVTDALAARLVAALATQFMTAAIRAGWRMASPSPSIWSRSRAARPSIIRDW